MLKILTTDQADRAFSLMIRKRDPICMRCHRMPSTDCSHFWERGNSATRFDPDNADGLCRGCHQLWEGRRNGAIPFKMKQIHGKKYRELEQKHNTTMKRDEAIIIFMKLLDGSQRKKVLS